MCCFIKKRLPPQIYAAKGSSNMQQMQTEASQLKEARSRRRSAPGRLLLSLPVVFDTPKTAQRSAAAVDVQTAQF